MATVIISYLLLIVLAVGFLTLALVILWYSRHPNTSFFFWRLLAAAFGLLVGSTIISSLFAGDAPVDIKGVLVDLASESRLANEIKAISATFNEPMPSEVYIIAGANAFVSELPRKGVSGKHRVLGIGLPLLQMLTIQQFRAILAHEFCHYYAGDTRLGPAVYNARRTVETVYRNLGKKSELLNFLRRWRIIAEVHRFLMNGIRAYWRLFMRITQTISRRQELRCDELACWVAGSQALIDGLENTRKCSVTVDAYWGFFVRPVATSGYRPDFSSGFRSFMQLPEIAQSASDYLKQQTALEKASPYDSHPLLRERIEQARQIDRRAAQAFSSEAAVDQRAISLIDNLDALEDRLIRNAVPGLVDAALKPLNWETAGTDIYIPMWRKEIASLGKFLSTRRMTDLPLLVLDPGPVMRLMPKSSTGSLNQAQRIANAHGVLFSAFAVCLLDNGWKLTAEPGRLILAQGNFMVDPRAVLGSLKCGQLTVMGWKNYRGERGIGDWPMAVSSEGRPTV